VKRVFLLTNVIVCLIKRGKAETKTLVVVLSLRPLERYSSILSFYINLWLPSKLAIHYFFDFLLIPSSRSDRSNLRFIDLLASVLSGFVRNYSLAVSAVNRTILRVHAIISVPNNLLHLR
jgi:hypothetical protein